MLKKAIYLPLIFFSFALGAFEVFNFSHIKIPTEENIIFDIEYSKAGKVLLIADGNSINWYSSENNELLASSENGHTKQIMTINLSNDSSWLVSGDRGGVIALWNVKKNQITNKLNYHNGLISSVQFSPDGKYILSGSTDNKVVLYDREQQQIKYSIQLKDDILSVAISPDQTTFCLAGSDGIAIYDFETGSEIKSFKDNNWIREVDFSSDSKKIIFCGDEGKVNIWSIKDPENIFQLNRERLSYDWLCSVKWHKDNKSFATGGAGGAAKISTPFGNSTAKLGVVINDIEFIPSNDSQIKIATATNGKGVIIIEGKNMKSTR